MQLLGAVVGARAALRRYWRRLQLVWVATGREDFPTWRWQRYGRRLSQRMGPLPALLGAAALLPLAGPAVGRLLDWCWEEHVRPDGPPRR